MKPVRQQKVRALLLKYRDGLTADEISKLTGLHVANVRTALRAMPDMYVDRWERAKRNQHVKVWCAVYVPPDAPHPNDKVFKGGRGLPPKTVWREVNRPV